MSICLPVLFFCALVLIVGNVYNLETKKFELTYEPVISIGYNIATETYIATITGEVKNISGGNNASAKINFLVYDDTGKIIGRITRDVPNLAAGGIFEFEFISLPISPEPASIRFENFTSSDTVIYYLVGGVALGIISLFFIGIPVYMAIYFKSKKFLNIKDSVRDLINDFNDLNLYADSLSLNVLGGQTKQYFVGETSNTSLWNYKHSGLFSRQNHSQIYHCSRQVVSNAQLNGFKYLCKYFNIGIDEEHRNLANEMLNNFISYTESRLL